MNAQTRLIPVIFLGSLAACSTGVRDIDFESKQFEVTYNLDSTRGIDSVNRENLMKSKAVYAFSKGGKGTNHTQMGMLSKDTPFTWKIADKNLTIDNQTYAIEKQDNGYTLRSDSAKIILVQQP